MRTVRGYQALGVVRKVLGPRQPVLSAARPGACGGWAALYHSAGTKLVHPDRLAAARADFASLPQWQPSRGKKHGRGKARADAVSDPQGEDGASGCEEAELVVFDFDEFELKTMDTMQYLESRFKALQTGRAVKRMPLLSPPLFVPLSRRAVGACTGRRHQRFGVRWRPVYAVESARHGYCSRSANAGGQPV